MNLLFMGLGHRCCDFCRGSALVAMDLLVMGLNLLFMGLNLLFMGLNLLFMGLSHT